MDVLLAFSIAGLLLLAGMAVRAKVKFVQNMLVPAAVIGGVLGFICMNTFIPVLTDKVSFDGYTSIVNALFTVSFISIGLTQTEKAENNAVSSKGKKRKRGPLYRGSMGMGLVWSLMYSVQAGIGLLVVMILGKTVGMDTKLGMTIAYGFCQGPGQAATNGMAYETAYGMTGAAQVGIAFSVIGFMVAFILGAPLARYGIRHGIVSARDSLDPSVARGYYLKEEQNISMGTETTYSGNIETMAFHMTLIGISYMIGLVFAKAFSYIPAIGPGLEAMMYLNGMLGAYVVNAITNKLGISHLKDNVLQQKITGFTSDFLVVMAFMSVQMSSVGTWMIPIMIAAVLAGLATFFLALYFGQRFGDSNDFERTLALFGTSTGTAPSGISLVRIVNPQLKGTIGGELGMMHASEFFSTFPSIVLMLIASDAVSPILGIGILFGLVPFFIILLKVFGCMNAHTWSFGSGESKVHMQVQTNP